MKSTTHRWLGRQAVKSRCSRSSGTREHAAGLVVRMPRPGPAPVRARARMRRTGRAPGHPWLPRLGVQEPPGLARTENPVERILPEGGDPGVQRRVAQRPGARRTAACGVEGGRGDLETRVRPRPGRSARPRTPPCGPRCTGRSARRAVRAPAAKKADALLRIAPSRRSSRLAASSWRTRSVSPVLVPGRSPAPGRSEEHTSELQSR